MPVTSQKLTYRVTIAGNVFRVGPGLQINKSLDQLCTVASFNIASRPSLLPLDGDSVLIEYIDVEAARSYPIFGGTVNVRGVVSEPWGYQVTCTDQLENFRRMRTTGDMNLTGMTDKEAWMAIADACDVDYDPDDIRGTTYELGALVPVKWLKDNSTSGGQIITEMDELFGFKTMTVGNNRVIRIHLDQTPADSVGLYRSYTKHVNLDFLADARTMGDRDQLQNAWKVTGVLQEISKSCTKQVWAKAEDGSAYLASKRVRVGVADYGSDMIQNEALAEYVVRRQMRLTNRLPDAFTVQVMTDHNVHVGTKVRVVDATKGIGAVSGVICMVGSMVITGFTMALELMPGPGGSEGTVTHGTEKVCNKTSTDTDTPGGFDEPDFDFPPLTDGIDGDDGDDSEVDGIIGEDELPGLLDGCFVTATFTDCDEDESDYCEDGSTFTEDLSGTSPADFCVTALNAYRMQTKAFTAGGPGFSTRCTVNVPWREEGGTGRVYYHIADDGAVDYITTINADTTARLYASTSIDPDNQDTDADMLFPAPLIMNVSGIVTFGVEGSVLTITCPAVVGGIESGSTRDSMVIYATPGFTFTPSGGTEQTFGITLRTDFQGPLLVGSSPPNVSSGALNSNNGGYVISSPAALGVPVAFSVTWDETHKSGWGWALAATDLGSGYLESLDFINPASPLPGEPADPGNTCAENHDAHKLCVIMNPGGAGTFDSPAIKVEGLIFGHTTCTVDPDWAP